MLYLRGAPALSEFRLEKLAQKISTIHPDLQLLYTEYVHFAQLRRSLAVERQKVLASLLAYGPQLSGSGGDTLADATLLLVVPRPGTISPWSSKATDIAHNCGLDEIERRCRIVGLATSACVAASRSCSRRRSIAGSRRRRSRSGRPLVGRLRATHPRAGRDKYRRC